MFLVGLVGGFGLYHIKPQKNLRRINITILLQHLRHMIVPRTTFKHLFLEFRSQRLSF